ncbi:MAG: TonB-dependent receptor [Bacteroidia bacterium]|nr:TonB-dependent receptor [Bacteroidia bacterium]
MRKLILGVSLLFLFLNTYAQNSFSVKGIIADKETQKVLAYCTISLIDTVSSAIKSNTFTDENGKFIFNGITKGVYTFSVKSAGYETNNFVKIFIDKNTELKDTIYLTKTSRNLKEVTIISQKALLEIETDKIIYNVENDATLQGLMAIDALRKLPFITVDAEDNIQLKGSSNFKVLLNGKNTSIIAKNPKEALKSFPANLIKKIEVITEPSAKYDAEGTSGIINIITHKKIKGYNGNIFGGISSRGISNFGGSINLKTSKLGMSSYFGGNYFNYQNQYTNELYRNSLIAGKKNLLHQWSNNNNNGIWYWGNIEISYDFDTLNSLSFYITPGGGYSNGNQYQNSDNSDSLGTITESYINSSKTNNNNPSFDLGIDYMKKFKDNDEHELSFSVSKEINFNITSFTSNIDYFNKLDKSIKSSNYSQNNEYTFKLDYEKPFKEKKKLETGAKFIIRNLTSDYEMKQKADSSEVFYLLPQQSNSIKYNQYVGSMFSTYAMQYKKARIKVGLRLENTWINAEFNKDSLPFEKQYLSLIPTLGFSKKIKKKNTIRINYSRRVQRPWMHYLNPYINNLDPKAISYGNPNLTPEKTHNINVSYNYFFSQNSLDVSISNSYTDDVITSYTKIDSNGVSFTSYYNIATSNTTGLNISLWGMFFKKIQIWLGYNSSYVNIVHKLDKSRNRSGFSHRGNGNFTWNFNKGFSSTLGAWVWQGAPTLQSTKPLNYSYNISLRKSFFKKKLNVGLVANNFFEKKQTLKTITEDPLFYQESISKNNFFRYYSFSLNYSFGKLKENVSRKKGSGNDDLKGKDSD